MILDKLIRENFNYYDMQEKNTFPYQLTYYFLKYHLDVQSNIVNSCA